jgi:Flp pilus assembly pilin Flp
MVAKFAHLVRSFHHDEEGLEALQVVMIIAIAAMIMIASATVGRRAVAWMDQQWSSLQGVSISADGSGGSGLPPGVNPLFPGSDLPGLPST